MTRPKLLDLFCGAGGAAVGYHRAGFDVVGVDCRPMPRYPFAFLEADALDLLRGFLSGSSVLGYYLSDFDAIHASPPCQRYSPATRSTKGRSDFHPDMVGPAISLLQKTGLPWVVENVMQAPLSPYSCVLCGTMFGLKVFRHRRFEASFLMLGPPCQGHKNRRIGVGGFCTVAGGGNSGLRDRSNGRTLRRRPEDGVNGWRKAMGIDWMTRDELSQAIPPAYTEFVGRQLLRAIG